MKIRKVHCLFEQSGTFKNEFKKLGIDAEDYDILNDFGETDHIVDLFGQIRGGYCGKPSIFDTFTKDDLIVAFFPCTRFEAKIPLGFRGEMAQQKNWDDLKKLSKENLEAARQQLMDILCNYSGMTGKDVILVFDAYRVQGSAGSVEKYANIFVVYTKEAQTADAYIEKTTYPGTGHRAGQSGAAHFRSGIRPGGGNRAGQYRRFPGKEQPRPCHPRSRNRL